MDKRMIMKVLFLLLAVTGICQAGCCEKSLCPKGQAGAEVDSVDAVLVRLSQSTRELKSYQGRIEYLFSQPLFESQTLRKGMLYYKRFDETSKLRINFQTLRQDDENEQRYIEQYIFDGQWLIVIDHQIKKVGKHQLADSNEPVDAFELARENFPIIGFREDEDLRKDFEIELIEQQDKAQKDFIQLHLKVKPDSIYSDDYTSVDFWIDKRFYLPTRTVAVSTEDDIYEIKLLNPKVNEEMDEKAFEVKIPKGFGEEIVPLERRNK